MFPDSRVFQRCRRTEWAKVNGDMWLATHPFATFWMIEDMDAMAAGNLTGTGTEAVAATRYQEFTALTA